MTRARAESQRAVRVGVVGAGADSLDLLDFLLNEPGFTVAAVADPDPEAPGAAVARARGVPVVLSPEEILTRGVDLVIEGTGRPEVREGLRAACPPTVDVIGAPTVRAAWELVERGRIQTARLRGLIAAVQGIGYELSLPRVLDRIVSGVAGLVGDVVVKLWLGRRGGELVLAASADERCGTRPGLQVMAPGRGLTGTVLAEGRPLAVEDVHADPRVENRGWMEREGLCSYAGLPLRFGDGMLGVLNVFTRTHHAFTPAEIDLLSAFAASAAVAIRRAQALEEATRVSREFESLADITQSIIGSLEAAEVFRAVVEGAARVLGADAATLAVFDDATGTLGVQADFGLRDSSGRAVNRWRLGEGLVGWVAQQLEPVFVPSFAEDTRVRNKAWARAEGLLAYGAIPLRVAGCRLVGVLTVFYRRLHAFVEEEVKLLTALGSLAAIAIVNAQLHGSAVRRGEELGALFRASRTVMAGLDLRVTLERIIEEAARIAGTPHVKVLLVDKGAHVLRIAAVSGAPTPPGFQIPLGASLSGAVAATGQPLFLPDVSSDPRNLLAARDRELGIVTFLGLPVRVREEVLGVLTFNTTSPKEYSADELAYLASFADQAAIAIENARLYADLQRALDAVRASQERQIQSERLRAVGEMASGIAHEFNNILAAILGRADLLLRQASDPTLRAGLGVILRVSRDGAQTVRRIQEFARVRRRHTPVPVRLDELAADALEFTRARWGNEAQAAGRAYRAEADLAPVPAVLGEASELREVLVNLVLNALDAMPDGGSLRVSTREQDHGVEVRVSDSGCGMTEEVRQRAFEPFFTTKGPRSSGLGLAVAYGIVERHGGILEIETEVGRGTTFVMRLPGAPTGAEAAASATPAAVPGPAPAATGPLRVLVVEDEEGVRDVLVETMTGAGHRVRAGADGDEGLALARDWDFDLLLTDMSLPGYSGWEIAEAVRARSREVPIVFVTGWGDQLDPVRLAALGRAHVLSKPFRVEDLLQVVARVTAPSPG